MAHLLHFPAMQRTEETLDSRPPARPCLARTQAVQTLRIAVLAASAATLAGCALNRPEARATAASVVESKGDVARLSIELELSNTGKDEVELVEYDYTVTLADGARYGGKWAALRALPPGEPVRATIPAVVPAASAQAGGKWSVSGSLRYRDPRSVARILYEAGILKPEVSFSGSGASLAPVAVGAKASAEESADSAKDSANEAAAGASPAK
jgi:hypothetical protein